jgi:hypothetical protein
VAGLGGGVRSEEEILQLRSEVVQHWDDHPAPGLCGILAAIDWVLGRSQHAPLTGSAQSPSSSGQELVHEEEHAHQVSEHPALSGVAPEYAEAAARTLLRLHGKLDERPLVLGSH